MAHRYDAIIVGARCAGSPLGMLLARAGYKVLIVDRATFPSDTLSTHVVHPRGVAALERWGLLDRLVATGCPPTDTYVFDFGPVKITGSAGRAYCARRTVLDKLLVDAAREAGAEVRERFPVDEVLLEDGIVTGIRSGKTVERARVVVGADGRHSVVAKAVQAEQYNERPEYICAYYAYWSGLPTHGRFENYILPDRGFGAIETHDGLTMVVGGWSVAAPRGELDATYMKLFEHTPSFTARLEGARRETKVYTAITPNHFRKPYGPGWALAGDAGYIRDPITAQGISDAFRDAELLSSALAAVFAGTRPFEAALADFQAVRDAQALPVYELTCQIASLAPPPPEFQQLLGAIQGNQEAMDAFVKVNAGSMTMPEFLARCGAMLAGPGR